MAFSLGAVSDNEKMLALLNLHKRHYQRDVRKESGLMTQTRSNLQFSHLLIYSAAEFALKSLLPCNKCVVWVLVRSP